MSTNEDSCNIDYLCALIYYKQLRNAQCMFEGCILSQALMTLHNLDDHISWLLQNRQIPPVRLTVHSVQPSIELPEQQQSSGTQGGDRLDVENEEPLRQYGEEAFYNSAANVVRESGLPIDAPVIPTGPQVAKRSGKLSGGEDMAKLSSASKSAKPSLLSQYQLASPASTTGTSISAAYAARFHKENASSRKAPIESKSNASDKNLFTSPSKQGTSKLLDPLKCQLSPCQTPQNIHVKHEEIEYLDLTGGNQIDSDQLGSSSSDAFGPNQTIWSADAASRTEPIKRGKKRKSDEIASTSRLDQRNFLNRLGKGKESISTAPIDEFVDIDTLSEVEDLPPPYSALPTPSQINVENGFVKETVESDGEDSATEEYRITETISRTETRIRKSQSRKPSSGDGKRLSKLATLSNSISAEMCSEHPFEHASPRQVNDFKIEYSPTKHHLSLPHRSLSPAISRSRTCKNKCKDRIIEDSEEDDFMGSTSPDRIRDSRPQAPPLFETSRKESAKATQIQMLPSVLQREVHEMDRNHLDIESPTHAASQNAFSGPFLKTKTSTEPDQRRSPSKSKETPKDAENEPGPSMPSFTLSPEVKILTTIYLQNPTSLTRFNTSLEAKDQEVRDEIDQLLDTGVIIPDYLKDRRKKLSEQKKCFIALRHLYDQYALLEIQKNELKKSIYAAFDVDDDELANEHQITLKGVTERVRMVETKIGELIRTCDIVEADFDIHINVENTQQSYNENQSEAFQKQSPVQRPSDSNKIGNTQVIYQTQPPTEFKMPKLTSNHAPSGDALRLPNVLRDQSIVKPAHDLDKKTRSPMQRPLAALEDNMQSLAANTWPRQGAFGNLSRASPQRSRIGFDDDFPEDIPDNFDEEMLDDHHVYASTYTTNHDEFGDFSEDDDLMAQFAEELDQYQDTKGLGQIPPTKDICGDRDAFSKTQKSNKGNPGYADLMRHAWSEDVKKALKENFHLRGFRTNQLEAINATLGGGDAFVLMPTGGGKSLCYQIPAVVQSGMTRGVTVVVSPLISLMQDQVDHLNHFGIPAFYINGEVALKDKNKIMNYLKEHHPEQYIKLLYVTPEMVKKSSALMSAFTDLYRRQKLARFVIDEAHCVSQWGHDFRPDYKAVGEVRDYFPKVPIIALTATATENVKIDVIHNLGINGCKVFSQSFNRPNLTYEIRPKQKAADVLSSIVDTIKRQYVKQSGIVYTLSRANCEKMADDLRRNGIKAQHYHAGLKAEQKVDLQKSWQQGKVHVIVATIAFGMGIDKPDVRFVIHHTIPKSLEGYYQETGRAGRDGKMSSCFLYYGYGDTRSLNSFIEKSDGSEEEKARQRKMLNRMIQYCENKSDCRRVELLGYFGERFQKEDCNHTCDNCNSSSVFETQDVSNLARSAVNVVKFLHRDNITILDCIKVLLGDKLRKETRVSPDEIEGYGVASGMHRGEIERIIYRLISENALMERNVVNKRGFANQYLELGSNSQDFMSGRRKLKLQIRVSPSGPKTKTRVAKKPIKSGTGVAAADLYAQSTDVSSPIRSKSRPRKERNVFVDEEAEVDNECLYSDAENVDNRGYIRDGFVASDDSDDGFEPVHDSIHHSKSTEPRPQLGPPITRDQRLIEANLNDVHLDVIQQFVSEAKKLEEKIRNEKGWKRPIFTDLQFREMAINWTTTMEDMLDISGINKGRVEMFGPRFAPLIERYHDSYESMMAPMEGRDLDVNHGLVIDLISDEGEEEDKYDEMEQDSQPSRYFPSSAKFPESNERFPKRASEIKAPTRHFPASRPKLTSKSSTRGGRGSSLMKSYPSSGLTGRSQNSGNGKRGVSRRGGRRGSSSFPRSRSASGASNGVSKRKYSSKRPSDVTNSTVLKNTFKQYAKKRDDRNGGDGGGGRGANTAGNGFAGFGMMPT